MLLGGVLLVFTTYAALIGLAGLFGERFERCPHCHHHGLVLSGRPPGRLPARRDRTGRASPPGSLAAPSPVAPSLKRRPAPSQGVSRDHVTPTNETAPSPPSRRSRLTKGRRGQRCHQIVDDSEMLLSFFDYPARGHWIDPNTTNPIESIFAAVRLRNKVTKCPGSKPAGQAMALQADQGRPRRAAVSQPSQLVTVVRARASFRNGGLVEGPANTA